MKINHTIKGFPNQIGTYIEFPDVADLLLMPMFASASVDYVYKHGTEFQKYLIDKTPLTNKKKDVIVNAHIQFLTPSVKASIQRIGGYGNGEWHIDSSVDPFEERDICHLITTKATALTEFNANPIEVELEANMSIMDYRYFINENEDPLGIIPKKMEPNKFTTFTNHVHRATTPQKNEFRYFFRLLETDSFESSNDQIYHHSTVFTDEGYKKNIEVNEGSIMIHL
ncbi:hypothetical protein [Chengkuizengella axinellae]|uniref:Uncharacterized protein n=1 Tax=Chengkuizengella axinellae TaxID=3064388 RepID=A0ABT9IWI3_9BACL|nr:hypothetical protein [Chengkuizengella sp. 2205SS18-9]MDP5273695.1 hypothetical protein [Chengkuizengella sp. 2205SS18-9]